MEREVLTADMSFREMLVRAQVTSPVLTYVVCSLLMEINLPKELNQMHRLETRKVFSNDPFVYFFNHSQELRPFIQVVFQNFTVRMNNSCYGFDDRLYHTLDAHSPFVCWVQHNVKNINDQSMEVTVPQ